MKMKQVNRATPAGFSLLELVVSTAILAVLSVSSMVLVRSSYAAWKTHEVDHAERQQAVQVVQHIVRKVRQAVAVVEISDPSDISGSLSLLTANGEILVWDHDAGSKEVRYGVNSPTDLLAEGVEELNFRGLKTNGWEQTTEVDLIHSVLCTSRVELDRPSGAETITYSCQSWLRSW